MAPLRCQPIARSVASGPKRRCSDIPKIIASHSKPVQFAELVTPASTRASATRIVGGHLSASLIPMAGFSGFRLIHRRLRDRSTTHILRVLCSLSIARDTEARASAFRCGEIDVSDNDEFGGDVQPWDDDYEATRPDREMSVLHQLQLYQQMVRRIFPYLDTYETTVLIQIVDRITGWKKREAIFRADALYAGDKMYGGIARAMDRSRMMKALRTLEARGVITRRPQRYGKVRVYGVNFDVDLTELARTARAVSGSVTRTRSWKGRVSSGDGPVSPVNSLHSTDDHNGSQEGTRESYEENDRIVINENTHPTPSASGARLHEEISEQGAVRAEHARLERSELQPPPRTRRRAD